jgi:oligoribonuclease NrnB/cAMP/cGMP phosphodiesterase (DHH superfamily)
MVDLTNFQKAIIVYHDDQDGWLSGYIAKKKLKEKGVSDIELLCAQYGDKKLKDLPELVKGKLVIIVDFSIQPVDEFIKVVENSEHTIWIDHHISAITTFKERQNDFPTEKMTYKLEVGRGACELTWEFFYGDKETPEFVKSVSRYDVWRWSDKDLYVAFFMRHFSDRFRQLEDSIFEKMLTDESQLQYAIRQGEFVFNVWLKQQQETLKTIGFETIISFNGKRYRAFCVNGKGFNSLPFERSEELKDYDLWVSFFYTGNNDTWTISLYSKKVDVSEIAKSMGGGGHKGAAGFQCSTLTLTKFLNIKLRQTKRKKNKRK